jgi:hypothetical protein
MTAMIHFFSHTEVNYKGVVMVYFVNSSAAILLLDVEEEGLNTHVNVNSNYKNMNFKIFEVLM